MLFTPLHHKIHQQTTQMHNKCNKGLCRTSVAILICLLASGVSRTNAVPTDSGSGGDIAVVASSDVRPHLLQRALRDVAARMMQEKPEDATTSTETSMDQPQGLCLWDGVLVAETTVFCEKKVGCRAIQKTGHCCPDYKCDCQKDGKTYLNGDKLVDPETPCTVCYCQGGEILCSSVTCFHRDDCTPKYIPGRCCPEYDNCPVPASLPNSISNQTLSSSVATTAKPEVAALNPKITIKEITKPIEIRITDKGIPIHQMLKPSSTETPSTTTTTSTTTAKPTTSSTTSTTTTTTTTAASIVESSTKPTPFSVDNNHYKNSFPVGGINNESLKLSASVAFPSPTQSKYQTVESTSSVEDFDEIVMVKNRNGDEKPISVFGTQGLQRVESESANDPSKVNIKREYLVTSEGAPALNAVPAGFEDLRAPEVIYSNGGEAGPSAGLQQTSAELEPDTAGSDNIYHIIMTTDGPRSGSTIEGFLDLKSTSSTEDSTFDSHNVTDNFEMEGVPLPYSTTDSSQVSSQETSDATPFDESTTERLEEAMKSLTTEGPEATSPESLKSTTEGLHHLEDDDIPIPMESNPAYPSLPEDDFSLRDVNFPLSETDDIGEVDLKDESRSIGSTFNTLKSTKHLDEQHNYMEGSGSGMLTDMDASSSTTDDIIEASSTTELLGRLPPKNIELMYSAEDSSEETSISNSTDFQLEKIMKEAESENGSGDSLEVENVESSLVMGSGSGSGELTMVEKQYGKQREHTTPRPTKKPIELDIDELSGGASGDGNQSALADDPKLDVESLKLAEDQDDSATKPDTAVKANILSVKSNPGQDKTAEEMTIGEIVRVAEEPESSVRVQRLYLQRVF